VNTSLRTSRTVAVLCIAAVVFAALVPALASATLGSAIFVPLWLVCPAVASVVIRRTALRCDEQPVALLSLVLSRAPPHTLGLA
jgi:hypothetical protein